MSSKTKLTDTVDRFAVIRIIAVCGVSLVLAVFLFIAICNTSCEFLGLSNPSLLIVLLSLLLIVFSYLVILVFRILKKFTVSIQDKNLLLEILSINNDYVYVVRNAKTYKAEYISENSARVLNLSKSDFASSTSPIFDLMDSNSLEKLTSHFSHDNSNSHTSFVCECTFNIHGSIRPILLRVYPISKNSRIIRYATSISDISEFKSTQQALKDALTSAQAANLAKRDFLSRMSHEIRTPMNAIMGMNSIALSCIDDQTRVRDCLNNIAISSKYLLTILNDVLDMSKIESGKLNLSNSRFNLYYLIEETKAIIYSQSREKKVNFSVAYDKVKIFNLIGDSLRLNQVLVNLLSNAVKFTPTGQNVSLTVQQILVTGHRIVFRFVIADSGIGIDESTLARIYDPFEQANPSISSTYGGTGLGLTIASSLIALMDGTISVDSKLNQGTEFRIEVPFTICEDTENELSKQTTTSDSGKDNKTSLDNVSLLVVEDNELNMEIICELLSMIGAKTTSAFNGSEAVTIFSQSPSGTFDAILMDVRMPIMNGYQATKEIKQKNPSIPIIAMTANAFSDDINEALECGMDAHITKPIDADTLVTSISTMLNRRNKHE